MSYIPPAANAVTASWVGASSYIPPGNTSVTASWVTGTPGSETNAVNSGILEFTGTLISTLVGGAEESTNIAGNLQFSGAAILTITSNLLVSETPQVAIYLTRDQYHLSDQLDTFDSSQYYYPPGASITSLAIVGSVVSGYSVDISIYSINLGIILHSYMDDYYYRIHIIPSSIDFGNILTDKSVPLEIWNAYLNTVDFLSVTQTNLSGITANLGFSLPKTYQPLEDTLASVIASVQGSASIDGYIEFIFSSATYQLGITGSRSVFFPFVADTELTETREWLTDIIPTRISEQKISLREIPRMSLSYSYTFRTEAEYANARQYAATQLGYSLAIALWTETVFIGTVVSTDSVIKFDTTYLEYSVGDIIVLWESYLNFSLHEISAISAADITLINAVGKNYTKCWIAPVKTARAMSGIDLSRTDKKVPTGKINASFINDPYTLASYTPDTTYLTYPVLENRLVVTGGLSDRGTRKLVAFDAIINGVEIYSEEEYNRLNQTIRLTAHTRQERFNLRRLIDWFQGKYQSFWLPSFNIDATATANILSGANFVTINYANWNKIKPKYIRIIGEYTYYCQVTNAVDNGDGTEDVVFTPAVTTDLRGIRRIEAITLMRLNSDRIEYAQEQAIRTTVTIPVIEENI